MTERTYLDLSGSREADKAVSKLAETLGIALKRLPSPTRFDDIVVHLRQSRPAFVLVRPDIMFLSRALRVKQIWFPPALAFVKGAPTDDTVEDLRTRGVSAVITPDPSEQESKQFARLCEARTWLKVRLSQMKLAQLLRSLDESESYLVTTATQETPAVSGHDWNGRGQKAWYGRIYVHGGAVVYCETPGQVGEDALEKMMKLADGFSVVQKVFLPPKKVDSAAPVKVLSSKVPPPMLSTGSAPPKPKPKPTMRGLGLPGETHPGVAPPPESAARPPEFSSDRPEPAAGPAGSGSARPAATARRARKQPPLPPSAVSAQRQQSQAKKQVKGGAAAAEELEMPPTPRHLEHHPMTGLVALPPPPNAATVHSLRTDSVTTPQPETARKPMMIAGDHETMEFEAPASGRAGTEGLLATLVGSESSLQSAAACTEDGWVDGICGHIDGETQAAAAAMGNQQVRDAGRLLGFGEPVGFCVASPRQAAYVAGLDKRMIVAHGVVGAKPLRVLDKMRAFMENSKPSKQS